MKSMLKMVAILLFIILAISMSGCFLTITQNLKDGSTLLVSSYDSLTEDYDKLKSTVDNYVAEPTEDSLKKYKDTEKIFREGFDAVGIAIKAEDEVIQSLKSKKEK